MQALETSILRKWLGLLGHGLAVAFLTVTTQLGGLAWLLALLFKRRLMAFLLAYAALSVSAVYVAPLFGRVALSCFADGPLQVQSWLYCATNRTYVTPDLKAVLEAAATDIERRYPGTVTLALDGSFPILNGFPLLPHLSHDDGEKVDLAFYYDGIDGYIPGAVRSPIGYFAFEEGPSDCPSVWPTLRWDLASLQPLWRDLRLDEGRTRDLVEVLAADPRVGKILIEPHLKQSLGLTSPKIRFQGCRAARHDDHLHLQL